MKKLTLVLEMEIETTPVAKARARHRVVNTKAGGSFVSTYTPTKTRDFEALVHRCAKDAMKANAPATEPICLNILFTFAAPTSFPAYIKEWIKASIIGHTKKPDLDNLVKAIKDGLNKVAWVDDSQVIRMEVEKHYGEKDLIQVEVFTVDKLSYVGQTKQIMESLLAKL